jgi:hypothetical protein
VDQPLRIDPSIVNKIVLIDGRPFAVTVMPPDLPVSATALRCGCRFQLARSTTAARGFFSVARVKGATIDDARAELAVISAQLGAYPTTNAKRSVE